MCVSSGSFPDSLKRFAQGVRYIEERVRPVGVESDVLNMAARLEDNVYALSGVWNTQNSLTRGLENIDFSYRLSVEDEPQHISYFKRGFGWPRDITLTAKMGASEKAPSRCSVSLIANYQDPYNYYELRLLQQPDLNGGDNQLAVEIWRCKGGDHEMLGENLNALNNANLDATQSREVKFVVIGNQLEGWVGNDDGGVSSIKLTVNDDDPIDGGGTVAFMGRDTLVKVSSIEATEPDPEAPSSDYTEDFGLPADIDDWADVNGRWTVSGGYLLRPLPPMTVQVYSGVTNNASATAPASWALEWEGVASSLEYSPETVVFNNWASTFVQLRQAPGDSRIVVDDIYISSWRGRTQFSDQHLPEPPPDDEQWKMTESWIYTGTDRVLTLDRTRADPSQVQYLRTPELTNGIGTVAFQFDVDDATAIFEVQKTIPGSDSTWETLLVAQSVSRSISSNVPKKLGC